MMNVGVIGAGARKETTSPSTSHDKAGKGSLLALRTVRTANSCYVRGPSGKTPPREVARIPTTTSGRVLAKIEA